MPLTIAVVIADRERIRADLLVQLLQLGAGLRARRDPAVDLRGRVRRDVVGVPIIHAPEAQPAVLEPRLKGGGERIGG